MRLAIDIDGCMTDDNRFRLEQHGKYLYEHNLPEMDLPYESEIKCGYFTEEQVNEFWNATFFEYIENVQPLLYVSEVMHKLKEDGHTIFICTGRVGSTRQDEYGEKVRNITINWLKKYDIVYDDIIFSGFPKINYIRPYNCDLFVEDNTRTATILAKEMPVLLFDNPYNVNYECDNVTRIFSWYDIYRHIKEGTY
ncbi:MAG: hypothetical protein IJJ19_07165 [Erysipelotrichaceae bacterium]|nr:hypothetical protein [Erysipelotrichaceae bacterium]